MIFHTTDMHGFNQQNSHEQQSGGGVDDAWAAVNMGNENDQEQPPPPPLLSSRTDSINSTTLFVNPNLVQPAFNTGEPSTTHELQSLAQQQHEQFLLQQQQQHHRQPQLQQQQILYQQQQLQQHQSGHSGMIYDTTVIVETPEGPRRISISENTELVINEEDIAENSNQSLQDIKEAKVEQVENGSDWNQIANLQQLYDHSIKSAEPSPTGVHVATTNFPGQFNFEVIFDNPTDSTTIQFSERLNKVFSKEFKWIQLKFKISGNCPPGLHIRALPVFADPTSRCHAVKRCPGHAAHDHVTNVDCSPSHVNHVIRFQNQDTSYQEDTESKRLSCVFPVGILHKGSDEVDRMLKFMCLSSCPGGLNRRLILLVFTLEHGDTVIGRRVVKARICSAPVRDRKNEEEKLDKKEENAKRIADKFASTARVPPPTITFPAPPPGKKIKMSSAKKDDAIVMIPVHSQDFAKLNEFAESAWICRNPEAAEQIRSVRKDLLAKYNTSPLQIVQKKVKPESPQL